MLLKVLLFVFWLSLMVLALRKWHCFRLQGYHPSTAIRLFLLKMLAGLALVAVYTYYYPDRKTADIYKFFDDGAVIASQLKENPTAYFQLLFGLSEVPQVESQMHNWASHSEQWLRFSQTSDSNLFNSNRVVTRIHAALFPLTGGWIVTHLLFFNLLVVYALFALAKQLISTFRAASPALIAFLLMPSVLFWCSGLLKDSLVLAGLCLIWASMLNQQAGLFARIGIGVLSMGLVLITKYYILAALIPAMLLYWILGLKHRLKLGILAMCLLGAALAFQLGYADVAVNMLMNKREEALKAAVLGDARSVLFYHPVELQSEFWSEILPSLWRGMFGPLGEQSGGGPFGILAIAESLLLLFCFLAFLFNSRMRMPRFAWTILLFSVLLAVIIGFTTPVTGGLLRYKTAFLPFLMYVLFSGFPLEKIKGFLTRWRGQ